MQTTLFSNRILPTTAVHRWLLAGVMLTVLALGWYYPLLGFIVPAAMLAGMLGGMLRGRHVCGNLCPRGSFTDTLFASLGPSRPIPPRLFGMPHRWLMMTGLMGFMLYRLAQNPGSLDHWGLVFWQMCLITTAAAMILGVLFRPRTWCAVCPVGTFAGATGGHKRELAIAESCRSCKLCEKNCPMGHAIAAHKAVGALRNRDCLQCSTCVNICPVSALELRKPDTGTNKIEAFPADKAPSFDKAA